jgi:hypothetical protein
MSAAAFGLYSARACTPGQKLAAGAALTLDTPLEADGVIRFARSLWLPVPAACRAASALQLADSQLALRFAPADLVINSGDDDWFTLTRTSDSRDVRLEFVWPAAVRRFNAPTGFSGVAFGLHRADGDNVVEEAAQSGSTNAALSPPWVGSPVVVKLSRAIHPPIRHKGGKLGAKAKSMPQARAAGGGGPVSPSQDKVTPEQLGALIDQVQESVILPTLTLAGQPVSPRVSLVLEAYGPTAETLLWQGIEAGEQAAPVTLPTGTLAELWAPALEQVMKALRAHEAEDPPDLLLRLDIESDAPCALTLQQAVLALDAEYALLAAPARFDFDGARRQVQELLLDTASLAGAAQSLTLAGRLTGEAAAAAPDASGAARQGVLLEADRALTRAAELDTPASLAGVALLWHPLSERVRGVLRLLPDSADSPGARPLLEQAFDLPTEAPGWLALRWPAVDRQSGRLWLRVALAEGAGIWLQDTDQPAAGWQEDAGGRSRRPLALSPAYSWLSATGSDGAGDGLSLSLGGHALTAQADGTGLAFSAPPAALALLASEPIRISAGVPASLTLEQARLAIRLA